MATVIGLSDFHQVEQWHIGGRGVHSDLSRFRIDKEIEPFKGDLTNERRRAFRYDERITGHVPPENTLSRRCSEPR